MCTSLEILANLHESSILLIQPFDTAFRWLHESMSSINGLSKDSLNSTRCDSPGFQCCVSVFVALQRKNRPRHQNAIRWACGPVYRGIVLYQGAGPAHTIILCRKCTAFCVVRLSHLLRGPSCTLVLDEWPVAVDAESQGRS